MPASDPPFRFRGTYLPAMVINHLVKRRINRTDILVLTLVENTIRTGGDGCTATDEYLCQRIEIGYDKLYRSMRRLKRLGLLLEFKRGKKRHLETSWSRICGDPGYQEE